MDTMWRIITVKNRRTLGRVPLLLLGMAREAGAVALLGLVLLALVEPGQSQALPSSLPATGSGASSGKTGAGQVQGPIVLPNDFSQFRIEPGDLLSVMVYDTPEFNNAYRVDSAGDVTLPLCGKVKVQGLTVDAAARLLEAVLKNSQILVEPQVTVDVQQYAGQYVNVLGEVASPGRVQVIAPTTLGDILAQVGGVTSLASGHIEVRHGDESAASEQSLPYSRSKPRLETVSVLVRPGDSITVPRAGIIYVLGAVTKPGGYVMQEEGKLNVAEALALAGGTLMQAKTNGLRVIRRNPDGTVLDFSLSYDGVTKGTQTPLALQAQDIVYVPMSKLKAVLSDATSIISSAASAAIFSATR
jgi:polysaccharide biosynthesis/export protein